MTQVSHAVEFPLTGAQRRALLPHIRRRRNADILWGLAIAGAFIFIGVVVSGRNATDAPWRGFLYLIFGSVGIVSVIVTLRWYLAIRRERTVTRYIGKLFVVTARDSEGSDTRFVDVGGREITVDRALPEMVIGGLEYTSERGYPVAMWGLEGNLIWRRSGYEPVALKPDSMRSAS